MWFDEAKPDYEEMVLVSVVREVRNASPKIIKVTGAEIVISIFEKSADKPTPPPVANDAGNVIRDKYIVCKYCGIKVPEGTEESCYQNPNKLTDLNPKSK